MTILNNSNRTAIYRKCPSAPARMLQERGLAQGRVLDHGCGRGKDAETYGWEAYDPHFQPKLPDGKFDTVVSNFVLNVLPEETERKQVLDEIHGLLTPDGSAFITVRADVESLNGWTTRGTWQGLIELELPVVHKTGWYTTYLMNAKGE